MTCVEDQMSAEAPSPGEKQGRRKNRVSKNRAVYSAIDLGTNNCRLLIAKPGWGGFRIIDAFSRIVRLGEGLGSSGRLSDEAMERAVGALKICAKKIQRRNVTCMRSVATEACRTAENCVEFVSLVKEETGLNLDVISSAEEARLAVAGCQSLLDPDYSHALVFDIGGGSTELILVEAQNERRLRILAWTSIPYGVVNLAERFGCRDLDRERYDAILSLIGTALERFSAIDHVGNILRSKDVQLLGTSGTVTTLASVKLGLARYDRNRVDGAWFESSVIHMLAREVALMRYEDRLAQPCIGADRADYVVAGCGILDAILSRWTFDRLRVADRGIREGVLRGLMGVGATIGLDMQNKRL